MAGKQTAFGIDFGTTNTRVAYFDGDRVRMVPLTTLGGQPFQYPTLIAYQNGEAIAWGPEAKAQKSELLFPRPIKWILGGKEAVEINGGTKAPVDVVADFFLNLRRIVEQNLRGEKLDRAALTIPVHYPPEARLQLQEACKQANIEVSHFFLNRSRQSTAT